MFSSLTHSHTHTHTHLDCIHICNKYLFKSCFVAGPLKEFWEPRELFGDSDARCKMQDRNNQRSSYIYLASVRGTCLHIHSCLQTTATDRILDAGSHPPVPRRPARVHRTVRQGGDWRVRAGSKNANKSTCGQHWKWSSCAKRLPGPLLLFVCFSSRTAIDSRATHFAMLRSAVTCATLYFCNITERSVTCATLYYLFCGAAFSASVFCACSQCMFSKHDRARAARTWQTLSAVLWLEDQGETFACAFCSKFRVWPLTFPRILSVQTGRTMCISGHRWFTCSN